MNNLKNQLSIKTISVNLLILLISTSIALLVSEGVARLVLKPENYLHVELQKDDILGEMLPPGTAGYDAWGFRNSKVPEKADIVALGDSHTFGNTAQMDESWPFVLGKITGRNIYNLGMGGYGPNQYFYLFKTKAIGLNPKLIICGLYTGDDFENAFTISYGLPHWSYLRDLPDQKVSYDIWDTPAIGPSWHKKIRVWLSRHSVVYMLVFHGPLLGKTIGEYQIKNASKLNPEATALNIPEKGISEAFLPKGLLRRLDQDNANVREGMRITFRLLAEMNQLSQQQGIKFIVAVIPTKELVFSDYIEHKAQLPLGDFINKLIANEKLAREKMFKFFSDSGIEYIDTLPSLKQSIKLEVYAQTAADMHPNKNGYRVIAESISDGLKNKPL